MTEQTDSELEQALERARASTVTRGDGPNKATLGLAGAVLLGAGFLGGYVLGGRGGPDKGPGDGLVVNGAGPDGPGPAGMARPANLTMGTITSKSGDTLTVKSDTGDTVKVKIGHGTNVRINKEGSIDDLNKGDNVVVNGQRDGDTIDAEDVGSGMMLRKGGPAGAGG
ncbi:MAG TPA: hypothetical protein VM093_00835 [Aeromicrobium sp.]|nr:hypothetical protein [Aeromicrobium sp.]